MSYTEEQTDRIIKAVLSDRDLMRKVLKAIDLQSTGSVAARMGLTIQRVNQMVTHEECGAVVVVISNDKSQRPYRLIPSSEIKRLRRQKPKGLVGKLQ